MKWCNFFNKISLILQALGCAGSRSVGAAYPMQPLSSCALSVFPRQCPAQAGYPGGLQVPDGTAVLLPMQE